MTGGFKHFGPTYPTTDYIRLGYEGDINGLHEISATLVAGAPTANGEANMELAGKFAAMTTDGVTLAAKGGANAVGLFREDLHDMVNASMKASFYFRGGEYYVSEARLGDTVDKFAVGDSITSDKDGKIVKADTAAGDRVLGTVVYKGEFHNGNMYQWAGTPANGGLFLGFILHM
jgi:hypothetical protein